MIEISVPRGFAFSESVVSHGWYRLAPFHWNDANRTLHRTEAIDGRAVDLKIDFRRKLRIDSETGEVQPADLLIPRMQRMFQLSLDLSAFHVRCEKSRSHRLVAERRFGRLLCGSTLFEDAVKIIATTNTTWGQTVRMVALLTENYGTPSESGCRAFPSAQQLAAAGPEQLRERCRLGYRSAYIHQLAEGIANGTIDLESLADPQQSTAELFASYRRLPGIGPYGAAHLLAMDGRHDHIAVDTEFRRFVRGKYFGGDAVEDAALLAKYQRWGRWKYLAYWSELWMEVAGEVEAG